MTQKEIVLTEKELYGYVKKSIRKVCREDMVLSLQGFVQGLKLYFATFLKPLEGKSR